MKKLFLFITAVFSAVSIIAAEGALNGFFSINAQGDKIQFSQGNLQYQASTQTWRFAEKQYDMIGDANANISASYSGWIDLLGWGTGNNPTCSTKQNAHYQIFTDWGTNAIINGGNKANQWRTLTKDEWYYLFYGRANAESLFAFATVEGVHGVIILPDIWTTPVNLTFNASTAKGMNWFDDGYYDDNAVKHFSDNVYISSEWSKMEAAGAVFLPTAGYRDGMDVDYVGSFGNYWSSTSCGENYAYGIGFSYYYLFLQVDYYRYDGQSVRIVQFYENHEALDNNFIEFKTIKSIKEGHLFIERNGKIYNSQGQEVK